MPLHALLHDLSVRTFDRLTLPRAHGWELREETVTEDLLLALIEQPAAVTQVYKSTTAQESVYGLDWLWSINTGGNWLTMWVQAKKGTGGVFLHYPGLTDDANELQSIRLLINAHNQSAIPVYAFFNPNCPPFTPGAAINFGACTRNDLANCPIGLPWENHQPGGCSRGGVTLADAVDVTVNAVFGLAPNRRHATSVNGYAMPWECLVCPHRQVNGPAPPGAGPAGPGAGPAAAPLGAQVQPPLGLPVPRLLPAVEYLLIANSDDDGAHNPRPTGVTDEAPEWATRLLEQGVPFEPSLTPDDDLTLPDYYVVTVENGEG